MQNINPQFIPRNYKVENAIFEAENNNDFSAMEKIIEITENPYTNNIENREYMKAPEFVDKNYKVVKVLRNFKPWRFSWIYFKASKVIELPSGKVPSDIIKGDQLEVLGV